MDTRLDTRHIDHKKRKRGKNRQRDYAKRHPNVEAFDNPYKGKPPPRRRQPYAYDGPKTSKHERKTFIQKDSEEAANEIQPDQIISCKIFWSYLYRYFAQNYDVPSWRANYPTIAKNHWIWFRKAYPEFWESDDLNAYGILQNSLARGFMALSTIYAKRPHSHYQRLNLRGYYTESYACDETIRPQHSQTTDDITENLKNAWFDQGEYYQNCTQSRTRNLRLWPKIEVPRCQKNREYGLGHCLNDEYPCIPCKMTQRNAECAICKDTSYARRKFLFEMPDCGHHFHSDCFQRWNAQCTKLYEHVTCPNCRKPFASKNESTNEMTRYARNWLQLP